MSREERLICSVICRPTYPQNSRANTIVPGRDNSCRNPVLVYLTVVILIGADYTQHQPATGGCAWATISPMTDTRDFGPVSHISAEAIGQPGQRRFRLHVLSTTGRTASLWLEKEQLAALGEAIENVLKGEGFEYAPPPPDDIPREPVFPLAADDDFHIGQLSMGVDQGRKKLVLLAAETAGEDDMPGLSIEFDYEHGHDLRRQIAAVVAAGRPPCRLCGAPIDPEGHICPRSNGHHSR